MAQIKAGERVDYMYSDELQIIQAADEFAFSLDTLLLANEVKEYLKPRSLVADLCAGNGAASLYLAYQTLAHFDAVEVQPEVASQAKRSVALNHLENRIEVHVGDVKNAWQILPKDYYDVVMVNPPYFKVPAGHKLNPDRKKAIARHELLINLDQIIAISSGLLKMKGKMVMVHRPERLGEIIASCAQHDLSVKVIQPFLSHRGDDSNLVVIVAKKHVAATGLVLKDGIVVHEADGEFTPAIQAIITEQKPPAKYYYFYVLLCQDGTFYGGFTDDVQARVATHNAGKGAKYTQTRRPVHLLYSEKFPLKRQALKREYWFKHHDRAWKEQFLRAHGVSW
ncbi:MAG: GIY-YIG nuclease family protein [Lactobacillus sp.]|jgi:putative endonuclease|nr:GIY-YIG nuclease family protein [Lactobacillus sp.]MCH3906155.1 GIY-YIG nuclease family protein [Lactobacillus sp.]MCH3990268.1 GIY-YIG nuclease family protein [Lactobacillus sp.]MCH4069018.1 GIY-YIG nuclease family protein [Lactobacillus sp.]MCI1303420.1 GIY-YIG nuclease family protein [Lactobacillus sp.]